MMRYGQSCPVAKSLDLVGDRWTLLLVRDLLGGPQRFQTLQAGLKGIAPNILSDRLKLINRIQPRRVMKELMHRLRNRRPDLVHRRKLLHARLLQRIQRPKM